MISSTRRCPLCGLLARALHSFDFGVVAHCRACDHRFSVYTDIYGHRRANERFSEINSADVEGGDRRLLALDRLYDIMPYLPRGASIFEIGCSSGEFLTEAHRLGYCVAGLDEFPHVTDDFDLSEIEIVQMRVENYRPSRLFDCVVGFHVLEHLREPVESLRRISQWIPPGGVLYLEVPNAKSVNAVLQRREWWGYTPDHASHFSVRSLRYLLEMAGFRVETAYGSVSWNEPCYPYVAIRNKIARTLGFALRNSPGWDVRILRSCDPLSRTALRYLALSPNLRCIGYRL